MSVEVAKKIISIIKTHPEYDPVAVKKEVTQLMDFGLLEIYQIYLLVSEGKHTVGHKNDPNSLIAYLLGITTQKPTGALTIPKKRVYARPGWPDIDIDICTERRSEVVDYCIEKYGRENVGNIGTIGLLKVASAVRRAVQVLDPENTYNEDNGWGEKLSPDPNNALRNCISDTLPTIMKDKDGNIINSLEKAYNEYPEFREYMDQYPDVYEVAKELEERGVIASKGVHAAGFILSPIPMADICPLHVTKREKGEIKEIATQFTMEDVESLGLIKMDLLGLSTETAIARTIKLVEDNYGIKLDFDTMERNDKATFDLLSSGKTVGVFQCENGGMQETLRKIGVSSVEDIAICIAMYRPGPMQYIDELADRKHGRTKVVYDHPVLEEVAKRTYGLLTYQEQTMALFVKMAGLTETDGYKFIKGCSKKKKDVVLEMSKKFIKGCLKNGVYTALAQKTAQMLERWSGYGFNCGHAVGYANGETYSSAYLKVHFPAEFMASQLSVEYRRKTDHLMKMYRQEVQRMGFTILPPDINRSGIDWEIIDKKTLLEPLIVKGIGIKAATEIIANRPYDGDDVLYTFAKKIHKDRKKPSNVDKDVVNYMWEAGMWPQFSKKEALIAKYDMIATDVRKGRCSASLDLF